MNFQESVGYLFGLGNEVLTMKFGLESIRRLLEELGNPHERFPSALIAGTNGKGSVSRFLSTVTSAAGLRTGLYTSPHLIRIQERIKVDGQEISEERFARHFTRVYDVIQSGRLPAHPTFFECVTATAFSFFAEKDVDFAVLEIGMGGRLDSTNVVSPLLSVITPISYDHQQYLGDTLAAIAGEKAGIMRKGSPVLLAEQEPEAEQTLRAEAERIAAIPHTLDAEALRILGHDLGRYQFAFHEETFQLRVPGIAQVQNAALALKATELLEREGLTIHRDARVKGIESTVMQGVLQVVRREPAVIVDGGHNPAAATRLVEYLTEHTPRPRTLLFGSMRDKDFSAFLTTVAPCFDRILLVPIRSPRAASPADMKRVLPSATIAEDLGSAFRAELQRQQTLVVSGSFVLAGCVLEGIEDGTWSPFGLSVSI